MGGGQISYLASSTSHTCALWHGTLLATITDNLCCVIFSRTAAEQYTEQVSVIGTLFSGTGCVRFESLARHVIRTTIRTERYRVMKLHWSPCYGNRIKKGIEYTAINRSDSFRPLHSLRLLNMRPAQLMSTNKFHGTSEATLSILQLHSE